MDLNNSRTLTQGIFAGLVLLCLMAGHSTAARALPPPKSLEELYELSDLVVEGRVAGVWLYTQWLAGVRSGGLSLRGLPSPQDLPGTDEEMLRRIRNFPYKNRTSLVVIDGIYLAEVQVEKVLKGKAAGVIFIPFVRYHFLPGKDIMGPWNERSYRPGEHLKMYLRPNGPFFESTWWNAVQPLDK